MNVIKYMRSIIQDQQMRSYYIRSPRFRDYVDRYVKSYKVTVEEALSHALVQEVAKSYKEAEAEEVGRIPASVYVPMGECV